SSVRIVHLPPQVLPCLADLTPDTYLFRRKDAPDPQFCHCAHANLSCLGVCEVVYPLFDCTFARIVAIECLFQCIMRLSQLTINSHAFITILFGDRPNLLTLLRREA